MTCLELDLGSPTLYLIPKRFDASRSKLAVIVINPQTLTWKLQYLQKGGQLEAHYIVSKPTQEERIWTGFLKNCGNNYFVEEHAEEHVILTPYFLVVNRGH